MRVHGVNQRETNQLVDGMSINSNEDCLCMSYADDAMHTEVSVTTSALPAESSPGGIRVNSIPRDGGNVVAGAVFFGGTDGNWQADNVDDDLKARRIQSANGIAHIQNFNGALGGPIQRDRLSLWLTARHALADETVANVEQHTDCARRRGSSEALRNQYIRDAGAASHLSGNQAAMSLPGSFNGSGNAKAKKGFWSARSRVPRRSAIRIRRITASVTSSGR